MNRPAPARAFVIVGLLAGVSLLGVLAAVPSAHAAPPTIVPLSPTHNQTVYNGTPLLVVQIADPDDDLVDSSLRFKLGSIALTGNEEIRFSNGRFEYEVPSVFSLQPGPNNVALAVADTAGETTELTYVVHYDPNGPPASEGGLALRDVVLVALVVFGVLASGLAGTAVYLNRIKGLTYRKLVARYPIKREIFTVYVPVALGVMLALVGLVVATDWPGAPRFTPEYVMIGAAFVALAPYALDVKRQRHKRHMNERAFAQFLFEMADAMRGGIDPVKATLELATTQTGILKRPLRHAADGIRLGRPFDQVLGHMAESMDSDLIARYSALVGEASQVGGEIAGVVYRAAKDMDELVKIDVERERQMKTPMFTMYVAFGVLLMMTATLMDFAPELAKLDIAALGAGGVGPSVSGGGAAVDRLSLEALEARFFHLILIMGTGTGLLVGSFTQGKPHHGLLHALFMVAVCAVFYPVVVL